MVEIENVFLLLRGTGSYYVLSILLSLFIAFLKLYCCCVLYFTNTVVLLCFFLQGGSVMQTHCNHDSLPISLLSNFYSDARTLYSISESRLVSLNEFVTYPCHKVWSDIPKNQKDKPSLNSFSKSISLH